MTHNVLQLLNRHPGSGKLGAKGMAENMRRDRKLVEMRLVVLVHDALDRVFKVSGNLRLFILVQKQKPALAVDNDLNLGLDPIPQHALECLVHLVAHGDVALAAPDGKKLHGRTAR